jgi:hypothetical protein
MTIAMEAGRMRIALPDLDAAVRAGREALLAHQRPDGHWLFELEADATIPAEYILLRHYRGEPDDLALESKIGAYLRRRVRTADGHFLKVVRLILAPASRPILPSR